MTDDSTPNSGGAGNATSTVRQFADDGGVTIKALIHYERLGLLVPARTPAGHRRYSVRDGQRLRRILALKRMGVALHDMRDFLDAAPTTLAARLEATRTVLARRREQLLRAERAIDLVQESLRYAATDEHGLDRLADVVEMQHDVEQMKRYFSETAWARARGFYEEWPRAEWIELYRDVAAAIPDGPASAAAEDLLRRWHELAQSIWREFATDRTVSLQLHEGFARAWRDRGNWPETIQRRFADYHMNEVAAFIGRVSIVVLQRRGTLGFANQRERLPRAG